MRYKLQIVIAIDIFPFSSVVRDLPFQSLSFSFKAKALVKKEVRSKGEKVRKGNASLLSLDPFSSSVRHSLPTCRRQGGRGGGRSKKYVIGVLCVCPS